MWWACLLCLGLFDLAQAQPMFSVNTDTVLPPHALHNPTQLNYGMAVTDVDGDGDLEVVVAGYNGPNLVLKYNSTQNKLENIAIDDQSSPYYGLRDLQGNAIGVTACDVDGDGREEIYFLNTNNAFSGRATYADKLFKFRNGRFEDLLSDDVNIKKGVANHMAGRSVACVDRKGTGRYSIYVANYARGNLGPHALIEMDEAASDVEKGIIVLSDVAAQANVNKYTGGRGVAVGPILSESRSDIFCDNENGPNFLFQNNGDGKFKDVAADAGVEDKYQHGRGVALTDFNGDGKTDIVYGNWNGPHRLYLQDNAQKFRNIATKAFSTPSAIRTVIAADFDNDQQLEVFFNNIAYQGNAPNRIFRVSRKENSDPDITELDVGDASEPQGRGTGATITDFDGDGLLDLLVAHGESASQPISVFKVNQGSNNNWLRVVPRTRFGAYARGAKVVMHTKQSGVHTRIIDGGSGYLCEMEPVAHFGLGTDEATSIKVYWPDGRSVVRPLESVDMNTVIEISYPKEGEESTFHSDTQVWMHANEEEESMHTLKSRCGEGFSKNTNGHCVGKISIQPPQPV
ncbi:cartilage acidic protein 1a isoform X1 [Triplophysa dalaica]|uniref:cartilage acidic protein 1a isoform X1 n=2 Tax=Triplophysa dalaica TaxID=1582913 RepID=UPI0024E01D9D|nr:cartilage acidic protein 1a isoform X1 [Triplophysa dalaica]